MNYTVAVVDVSAILAVLLNEPSRPEIERTSTGISLAAPGCLPWEFGNAMYSAIKRGRLTVDQAIQLFQQFQDIPVRILDVDIEGAIEIAAEHKIPTYDAYYLECAVAYGRPLLSLDDRLCRVAKKLGVSLLGRES